MGNPGTWVFSLLLLIAFKSGFSETVVSSTTTATTPTAAATSTSTPTSSSFNLCSLEALDSNEGFLDPGTGLKFLWSLCPEKKSGCDDPAAAVCVFKV